jgi:hypothetical protein
MADYLRFGQYPPAQPFAGNVTLPGLATFSRSTAQGNLYPPDVRFSLPSTPTQYTSTGQPLPHPFDLLQASALSTFAVTQANGGSLR